MNSTQIECFTEVAGQLSFSRAAERLHLSQPTVSNQIRSLEEELGAQLLARSTRTVRLTDAGFAFLPYAQEMLDLTIRARRQLHEESHPDTHTLKVGVQGGFEARVMAGALGRLREEHPDLVPVLRQGPQSALCEMLEAGTIDVLPSFRDPKGEKGGASTFRRICEVPVRCACAPSHPLAARSPGPVGVEELKGAGRVVATDPHRSAPAMVEAQRDVVFSKRPSEMIMGPDLEATLALAGAGFGFALVPDVSHLLDDDLCYLPVEGLAPVVFGVRVRRGRRSRLLDRFLEVLADELLDRGEGARG